MYIFVGLSVYLSEESVIKAVRYDHWLHLHPITMPVKFNYEDIYDTTQYLA